MPRTLTDGELHQLLQLVGRVATQQPYNALHFAAIDLLKQLNKEAYLIKCDRCHLPPAIPLVKNFFLCRECMQTAEPSSVIDERA